MKGISPLHTIYCCHFKIYKRHSGSNPFYLFLQTTTNTRNIIIPLDRVNSPLLSDSGGIFFSEIPPLAMYFWHCWTLTLHFKTWYTLLLPLLKRIIHYLAVLASIIWSLNVQHIFLHREKYFWFICHFLWHDKKKLWIVSRKVVSTSIMSL